MSATLTLENAVHVAEDFASEVKTMTEGRAVLTGEFPDLYVLDHMLSPHYGTQEPSDELKDFALSAGVYTSMMLARFWNAAGLQSEWQEAGVAECGIGLHLTSESGTAHEYLLLCPSDVYGMLTELPNPFPQFVGSWMTYRKGDPLLPRYALGALLLSQPMAQGDWPKLPPGEGAFMQTHMAQVLELLAASCARDIEAEEGLRRRMMEAFYERCLWPAVGALANDYGVENVRALASAIAFAGKENRDAVLEVLDAMEKGWVADGAYLAGLAARTLRGRDDVPGERMGFTVPEVRDVLEETRRIFEEVLPGWIAG